MKSRLKTYPQFKPVANLPVLMGPAHLACHHNSERSDRRASFYCQINTENIQLEVFNSWFGSDAKKENLGTYHQLLFLCLRHLWIQSGLSFEARNRVCTTSN